MDLNSQNKVLKAGFMLILGFPEWRTFEKFDTKAARDRRFKELLHNSTIIED